MSEQRPVPQQFPSRRQRREQQQQPVAPQSIPSVPPLGMQPNSPQAPVANPPVPGSRVTQLPVAQPPGVPPLVPQPRVTQQSVLPHHVSPQEVTSTVPPVGYQPVAKTSDTPSPASTQPTRPVPPGVAAPTEPDDTAAPAKRRRTPVSVLVMSGVGQTMLTVGVVLGLFVVWQLYVTTWQVQGATAAAVQSFQKSTANDATAITEVQRTDPPPGVTIPAVGQTFGTLHVPRWDSMVIPIMQGTNEAVLDTGYAGHYTDTQGPGELGNFALAAHRRSYGNSFRRVHELQTGDPLVVETSQAWLVYQVTSTEIVLPAQGDVIYPVPHEAKETVPHERLMTLTTCHPEYGNTQRFIVYSKFSYWVPRTQGRPFALKGLEAMKQAGQGTAPEGPQDGTDAPVSDPNAIAPSGDASSAPAEGLAG